MVYLGVHAWLLDRRDIAVRPRAIETCLPGPPARTNVLLYRRCCHIDYGHRSTPQHDDANLFEGRCR